MRFWNRKKDNGKTGKHSNKVCSLADNTVINVNFLFLIIILWLWKMLTLGEGDERYKGILPTILAGFL